MPFLSIIMPVYNASKTLNRAIKSVLKQTCDDWELICVDDGSVDDSLEILKKYAKKDVRIRVFHKENSGPGLTRNYGLSKSRGKYIGFLDSDDAWNKHLIEELVLDINKNDSDIVILGTVFCRGKSMRNAYDVKSYKCLDKKGITSCMMSGLIPWGQEKVIRTSIIEKSKARFSADSVGEECIFSFDCLYNSNNVSFIDKPMYYYFINDMGQHKKGDFDPWFGVAYNMRKHLMESRLYNEYYKSVNSLAMRSFCIMLYRYSCRYTKREARIHIKERERKYSKFFNMLDINTISIDKRTRLLYWLWRMKMYSIIYMFARLRERVR